MNKSCKSISIIVDRGETIWIGLGLFGERDEGDEWNMVINFLNGFVFEVMQGVI